MSTDTKTSAVAPRSLLSSSFSPSSFEWLDSVDSVMAMARTWLSSAEAKIQVESSRGFSARVQTAGVGQRGRPWDSLDGNVHLAIGVKKGSLQIQSQFLLPHLMSIAVCRWIQDRFAIKPTIKWPNDILLNGCKVAGILCEGSISGQSYGDLVIGIGVNLNSLPLVSGKSYAATSMLQVQKIQTSAQEESKNLYDYVVSAFSKPHSDPDELMAEYATFATMAGHVWDTVQDHQEVAESFTQGKFLRDGQLRLLAGRDETILSSSSDLKVVPRAVSQNFHLVADVGNSRIKLSILRLNPDLHFQVNESAAKSMSERRLGTPFWDLLTDITLPVSNEADLFQRAGNWLRNAGASRLDTFKRFITLNAVVVSDHNELILKNWCQSQSIHYRRLIKRPLRLVRSRYDLVQMGDDRFFAIEAAMALAIHENIHGAMMVVSLGTATTIDFIDHDRLHHGGQIGVGANTGLSALSNHTSRLPMLALDAAVIKGASISTGLNTKDAMTTAAVSMQCHWILGERKAFAARLGVVADDVTVILSGGLSREMESELLSLMGQEKSPQQNKKPSENIFNVPNLVQLGALLGAISQ